MRTYGMQTQTPQYDWANIFTQQARLRYSTTGRASGATTLYKDGSSALPSNPALTMIASDDANVIGMLSQQGIKSTGITPTNPDNYKVSPWTAQNPF